MSNETDLISKYKEITEGIWAKADRLMNGIRAILNGNFINQMRAFECDISDESMSEFFADSGIDADGTLFRINLIEHAIRNKLIDCIYMNEPAKDVDRKEFQINAKEGYLHKVFILCWEALHHYNSWPRLFQVNGKIARLRFERQSKVPPKIQFLGRADMRHELVYSVNWFKNVGPTKDKMKEPAYPPDVFCDHILATPNVSLPHLERVVHAPFYDADGNLIREQGYHANASCYYHDDGTLKATGFEQDLNPTPENLIKAKATIDDILIDFPFIGDPEKAHALAILLHPFVRDMISGPTPQHLIESPSSGTGKTWLAEALILAATGQEPAPITEAGTEYEWGKKITSTLMNQDSYFFIDNVKNKMNSGSLSSVLTTENWQDRLLQKSENVTLPVRCCFVTTGNNVRVSTEIARRTVRIRLDSGIEKPWLHESRKFRYPNLFKAVRKNRGALVWSVLILVENWKRKGMPKLKLKQRLGGYEQWSDVVGGILEAANIQGFLGNLHEFYESSEDELTTYNVLIETWWDHKNRTPVMASDLYRLIKNEELPIDLGYGTDLGQKINLGKILKSLKDRKIGHFTVRMCGVKHKTATWKLEPDLDLIENPDEKGGDGEIKFESPP